jgi:hypothetical protein
MSWVFVGTNVLAQAWGGYRTFDVCFDQLAYGKANYFLQNMEATTTTTTSTYNNAVTQYGWDAYFDTVYFIGILDSGLNTYFAVRNYLDGKEIYLYELGHYFALFLSRFTILIDKAAKTYLLVPYKPWIRFKK